MELRPPPPRAEFDAVFEAECRRCERAGVPLSVVLFEIDDFDAYCRRNGQDAADALVEEFATVAARCAGRPGDMFLPLGDAKFILVLPFTSAKGAAIVAERMRHATERVAVSAGIACAIPTRESSPETFLADASRRLERVRARGGNAIEGAPEAAKRVAIGPQHNLPPQRTSFVGRGQDVARVRGMLERERMVTLLGPGGAGKTRMAIEAARPLVDRFEDGVWFLDMTRVHDVPSLLLLMSTIAGVGAVHDDDVKRFADRFRERAMLLVFDNCEQLLSESRQLIAALLQETDNIKILATSREALGVNGERVYRLPMLQPADAVQLFVDRAAQNGIDVAHERTPIEQIVTTLEGMPLAIELAAARLDVMTVGDLAASLDDALNVLHAHGDALPTRQQTLRALIDWSYELLDESEQRLFRRLAIFPATFARDAVEPVTGERADVLDALVAKSLVIRTDIDGRARFRFLHITHGYARAFLEEAGELEMVLERLAMYFSKLSEQRGDMLATMPMRFWLELRAPERENLIVSLRYTLERPQLQSHAESILKSIRHWSHERGPVDFRELLPLLEDVIAKSQLGDSVMAAVFLAAADVYGTRDLRRARDAAERALRLYREIDDGLGAGHALERLAGAQRYLEGGVDLNLETPIRNGVFAAKRSGDKRLAALLLRNLADIYGLKGDDVLERAVLLEAYELLRECGDDDRSGSMLARLAVAAFWSGDYEEARSVSRSAITLLEQVGEPWNLAFHLMNLGLFETFRNDYAAARSTLRRALQLLRRYGHQYGIANTFVYYAILSNRVGQRERAIRLAAYADSLFAAGPRQQMRLQRLHDELLATLRESSGVQIFERNWRAGRAMRWEQALQEAEIV